MKQVILILDYYADVSLSEALGANLPPVETRVEFRLRYFSRSLPSFRGQPHSIEWPELLRAADRLIDAAISASETEGGDIEIYLGGLAPLPIMAYVAQRTAWAASRRVLFGRRKDGSWQIFPLFGETVSPRPFFDDFSVAKPAVSFSNGRLAVFISNLGMPPPKDLIDDLFRKYKQPLAAIAEVRTSEFKNLDETSCARAFSEMCDAFARLSVQFPSARGAVFFIAGPMALAGMLGFGLPAELPEPWFANHEAGAYRIGVPILSNDLGAVQDEDIRPLFPKAIRVSGFKSIRDSGWIELPSLGVIVGRNGSGKSALLEALQWLQEATEHGLRTATRRYRSFSDLRNKSCANVEIELDFVPPGDEQAALIRYHVVVSEGAKGSPILRHERCMVGDRAEITSADDGVRWIAGGPSVSDPDQLSIGYVQGTTALAALGVLSFFRHTMFLRLSPSKLAQPGPLQADSSSLILDEDGGNLSEILDSLSSDEVKYVTDHLRAAFADGAPIHGIGVERNSLENTGVLVMEQALVNKVLPDGTRVSQIYRLPAWVLSEGTRRLAAIFAAFSVRRMGGLTVIEEIENGLDPWTLSYVLEFFRQAVDLGACTLLTTHSPYFLDKFRVEEVIHAFYERGESRYRAIKSYDDVVRYEGDVAPGVMYVSRYFSEEEQ